MAFAHVEVKVDGAQLRVTSPYSEGFVSDAHSLDGQWDRESKEWVFALEKRSQVEEALNREYGYRPVDGVGLHAVEVDAYDLPERGNCLLIGGVKVASRSERDSDVRLADGVWVMDGSFPSSGGSRSSPRVAASHGTILCVEGLTDGQIEWLDKQGIPWKRHERKLNAPGLLNELRAQRDLLRTQLDRLDQQISMLEAGIPVEDMLAAFAAPEPGPAPWPGPVEGAWTAANLQQRWLDTVAQGRDGERDAIEREGYRLMFASYDGRGEEEHPRIVREAVDERGNRLQGVQVSVGILFDRQERRLIRAVRIEGKTGRSWRKIVKDSDWMTTVGLPVDTSSMLADGHPRYLESGDRRYAFAGDQPEPANG